MMDLLTKGAWFEIILAMWDAPDRGVLSGTLEEFHFLLGCSTDIASTLIDKFERLKICDVERTNKNGIEIVTLKCRRMVREEAERKMSAERQAKFREKKASSPNVTENLPLFQSSPETEQRSSNAEVTEMSRHDFSSKNCDSNAKVTGYVTVVSRSSNGEVTPYISEVISQNTDKTPCNPPKGDENGFMGHNGNGSNGNGKHDSTEFDTVRIKIGSWFSRRPTTRWSDKERKALAKLLPIPEHDLSDLHILYTRVENRQYLRHDVMTLLNNFSGEIDRAREYISAKAKPKACHDPRPF